MNLSKFDIGILLSMALAVISMSIVFPMVGLTGTAQDASDIPEFNLSKNQFAFATEPPEFPSGPNQGRLIYSVDTPVYSENTVQYESQTDAYTTLTNGSTLENPSAELSIGTLDGQTLEVTTETINNVGESVQYSENNWTINFKFERVMQRGEPDMTLIVSYRIIDQPSQSDDSWLSRIPLVGGALNTAGDLGRVVGWIASMLFHYLISTINKIIALLLVIFNLIVFIVTAFGWLTSTYGGIIAGAPTSYASVFVSIPGLLLSYELGKVTLVIIRSIPVIS